MNKMMGNFQRDLGPIKKNPVEILELKNAMSVIKTSCKQKLQENPPTPKRKLTELLREHHVG